MEKGKKRWEEEGRRRQAGLGRARAPVIYHWIRSSHICCDDRGMSSRRQAAASATHRERKKRKEQGEAEEGLIVAF